MSRNSESSKSKKERRGNARWQRSLRKFFQLIWVEVLIGALVIVSVVLTLVELRLEALGRLQEVVLLESISHSITLIFVIELLLRWLGSRSTWKFLTEHWLDILAVLPVFRVLRAFRALRLLRLFRILRLFGVMNRLASHFPYVFQSGIAEYLVVILLLVVTVVFGTGGMMLFENPRLGNLGNEVQTKKGDLTNEQANINDSEHFNIENSFWFSIFSLVAGEPIPKSPNTRGGKIIAVIITLMGLTIFAMFTGTISAFMVERFRTKGRTMELDDFENHVVICGWNYKAKIIIDEYQANHKTKSQQIVVITELDLETGISELARPNLAFIQDDFTKVTTLDRVRIKDATTCILLADTTGGRSEQDVDARTILAALTVEKMNPEIYTCAELINRSYGSHLDMGHVNDYVVSGEHSAYIMAQASMHRGLMDVLGELLTHKHGQRFIRREIPDGWVGQNYVDVMIKLKSDHNATLVAVHPLQGEVMVNPREYQFEVGDEVVLICERTLEL